MGRLKTAYSVATGILMMAFIGGGCSGDTEAGQFSVDLSAAMKISRCFDVPIGRVGGSDLRSSEYLNQVACVASAQTCLDVKQCLSAAGDGCRPTSDTSSCNGTVLTSCVPLPGHIDHGVLTQTDCSANPDGNTMCGTYDRCFDLPAEERGFRDCPVREVCAASTCMARDARCEGFDLVTCDGGVRIRKNCGNLGLTCVNSDGVPRCAQPGYETCTGNFCSGGKLVLCSVNDSQFSGLPAEEIDCGGLHPDFACIESGNGSYCGVSAPNRVCESGERECINGRTVGICAQGVWVTGSCGGFMSGRCDYSAGSLRCVVGDRSSDGAGSIGGAQALEPCSSGSDCAGGVCGDLSPEIMVCIDPCTDGMCSAGLACIQGYCIPEQLVPAQME